MTNNTTQASPRPFLGSSFPLSPTSSRNSRAIRVAYLIQALFTIVCLAIFVDLVISRSTLIRKPSRIERVICQDPVRAAKLASAPPPPSSPASVNLSLNLSQNTSDSKPTAINGSRINTISNSTSNAAVPVPGQSYSSTPSPTGSPLIQEKRVATFVITCGTAETDAVAEMGALLKSLLVFASQPVRLIFITDANGVQRVWNMFAVDLVNAKRKLWVDVHLLNDSIVNDWAARIRLDPVGHHSGRWGTAKLMLPWILKDLDRVVVLDTDMVFVEDPIRLWDLFEDGDERWVYQMPVSNKASYTTMCSCIVLIKLDLARQKGVYRDLFYQALLSGPRSWFIEKRKIFRPITGDQGLYFLMMKKFPDLFKLLPSNWDKDHCHNFYGALDTKSKQKVSLLHRNCAGQNSAIVKDQASPFFDFFLHYRWHWLTPQSGKSFPINVRKFTVAPL